MGRHDVARKTVFARLEGDSVILAVPDNLLDLLPKNPWAFRERSIIKESPSEITKLIVRRGDRVDELVPVTAGAPNTWRMLRPVEAAGDAGTITQVLTALCGLRSLDFVAAEAGDGKAFGLDRPAMQVDWESKGSHSLKIGDFLPRSTDRYATTDGQPLVFTLPSQTVRLLDAEYRDHRVMSFPLARAGRIVLRLQGRTVILRHRPPQARGQVEWVPEPGSDVEGLDLSRIGSLVTTMSQLQTTRFIQYEGDLPPPTGLRAPAPEGRGDAGPEGPGPGPPHRQQRRRRRRLRRHGRRAVRGGLLPPRPALERPDPLRPAAPSPARQRLRAAQLNPIT